MGCVVLRARGISFDTTDGNNESARRREATCFLQRILIRNAGARSESSSSSYIRYEKERERERERERGFFLRKPKLLRVTQILRAVSKNNSASAIRPPHLYDFEFFFI